MKTNDKCLSLHSYLSIVHVHVIKNLLYRHPLRAAGQKVQNKIFSVIAATSLNNVGTRRLGARVLKGILSLRANHTSQAFGNFGQHLLRACSIRRLQPCKAERKNVGFLQQFLLKEGDRVQSYTHAVPRNHNFVNERLHRLQVFFTGLVKPSTIAVNVVNETLIIDKWNHML
jgi:hypothetical protein